MSLASFNTNFLQIKPDISDIRAGRYIEYTLCIAACSLWDVENDYIVNTRVYIELSRSCF